MFRIVQSWCNFQSPRSSNCCITVISLLLQISRYTNHVKKCYEHSVFLGRLGKQTYSVTADCNHYKMTSKILCCPYCMSLQLVANSRAWLFKKKFTTPTICPPSPYMSVTQHTSVTTLPRSILVIVTRSG